MNNLFILYYYKLNEEIIYVGQTIRPLKYRHQEHLRENSLFKEGELYFAYVQNQQLLNFYEHLYILKYHPQLNKALKDEVYIEVKDDLIFYKYEENIFHNSLSKTEPLRQKYDTSIFCKSEFKNKPIIINPFNDIGMVYFRCRILLLIKKYLDLGNNLTIKEYV